MQMIKHGQGIKMTTVEIAKQVGKQHKNVMRDTKKMLIELYGENNQLRIEPVTYVDSKGEKRPCYELNKNDILTLVSGYSIPLRASIIKRLDELEKNNTPKTDNPILKQTEAKAELDLELFVQDYLNTSKASKLEIIHMVYDDYGITTKRLPQYTENVKITFSAKDLLKQNDCKLSSIAFNKLMIANGYMSIEERTASEGKIKKYKALTDKGLKYGQNDASKHSPRETQAHYFKDSFTELYKKITEE